MFVQTVNLPYFHHADEEALRDQERLERDESEDEMLADDGVEERGDDEEYLQDDGEEEAGAEVIIAVALSNMVNFYPQSQIFLNFYSRLREGGEAKTWSGEIGRFLRQGRSGRHRQWWRT